jgi:hypothetical protein
MSGEPSEKTFEECDAATRFRWAMQYLVCVLAIVFLATTVFWIAYDYLPMEFVILCNFYLIAGVWVCSKDRRMKVAITGTWNVRSWYLLMGWWMRWPYLVYSKFSNRLKR